MDLPHLQIPSSLCASSNLTLHVQQRFLFFCPGLSDCVEEDSSLTKSKGLLDVVGMSSSLVTAGMLILGIPTVFVGATLLSDGWLFSFSDINKSFYKFKITTITCKLTSVTL